METSIIFFIVLICILIISLYSRYVPKIDIVLSKNKYIVLLWYNKYYMDGECKRTFKKLFEI